MKGHRTEDNIFILQTLFHKYAHNKRQKVFLAFVDFSKYFDSLIHEHLYYKMLKIGICGYFYHLIKSMYANCRLAVKTKNGLSYGL